MTSALNRLFEAVRQMVLTVIADERLKFSGIFAYTISEVHGDTFDALPSDPTMGLPGLTGIPCVGNLDVAGFSRVPPASAPSPSVGTSCRIMFVNRDPAQPIVVSVDSSAVVNAGFLVTDGTGLVKAYYPGTLAGEVQALAQVALNPGPPAWQAFSFTDGRIARG